MDTINENKPAGIQEAMDELKQILQQLESGEINIDKLPQLIIRAKFLSEYCENELTRIDELIRE